MNAHSCLPVYPLCWIHAGVSRCVDVRGEKTITEEVFFNSAQLCHMTVREGLRTPLAGSTWAKAVLGTEVYLDTPAYAAGEPGGEKWETLKTICRQRGNRRVRVGANAAAAFCTTDIF